MDMTPSQKIDELLYALTDDWRGATLKTVREAILAAEPGITEAWKWMGSPVWEKGGIIVVGNAHSTKVKLTFHNGASLPDPEGLFNNGLEGGKWRSIDYGQGEAVNVPALQALVRAAAAFNLAKKAEAKARAKAKKG